VSHHRFGSVIDIHLGARDPTFLGFLDVDGDIREPQYLGQGLEFFSRRTQINQGPEHHIAADSGKRFDLEGLHEFFRSRPRIRAAAMAAPKPLSILTTVSPLAQLASMACRAVVPPSATP